ncbi:MAG: sortase [Clostridia bacterium]|nr:sortase [Clostridia bacterium]
MSRKKRNPSDSLYRRLQRRALTVVCVMLLLIIVGLGGYAAGWFANRARIQDDADRYRAMYSPEPTAIVPLTLEPTQTPEAAEPTPEDAAPTPEPTDTPAPAETGQAVPLDEPIGTRGPQTQIYALPTAPPVQQAFSQLIQYNPDTVGYLDIPGFLSLPVTQRENDNEYYLTHNFDGEESREGCLFLDGVNRLTPEDDCLIVYGHNMKNGAMFGRLDSFAALNFMKMHPLARFDTIYENRLYVPFAAFTASMKPGDSHYFDVRQFVFDETRFELFTLKMQSRSALRLPVDVRYGDKLLLLVTCDYTNREGRFILALRRLRPDEDEQGIRAMFAGM